MVEARRISTVAWGYWSDIWQFNRARLFWELLWILQIRRRHLIIWQSALVRFVRFHRWNRLKGFERREVFKRGGLPFRGVPFWQGAFAQPAHLDLHYSVSLGSGWLIYLCLYMLKLFGSRQLLFNFNLQMKPLVDFLDACVNLEQVFDHIVFAQLGSEHFLLEHISDPFQSLHPLFKVHFLVSVKGWFSIYF